MQQPLTIVEIRVLGSLIEKQLTTPDYYPLTLNSLTTACNQKNNRDPVTSFDETTVLRALDLLREKNLVSTVTGAGIRVPKYKHMVDELLMVTRPEISLLCLLMLRGPQTVGELRGRSGPMYEFPTTGEVEAVLSTLADRAAEPLARQLPRRPGQKEARYSHTFAAAPETKEADLAPPPEPARLHIVSENERIERLEELVQELQTELEQLQGKFSEFKRQFE